MDENKFKCNICNKYYKSYQSLWNHKKKFHAQSMTNNDQNYIKQHNQNMTNNDHNTKIKKTENTICEYCNKTLSAYTHLRRHLKICKTKINILKENEQLKLKTQQQEQRILNIEQKLDNITNKMELTPTNNNTINNNTTNNNINKGTINNTTNNINVFKFGLETVLENLPKDEAVNLLRMTGFKSLVKSILLTYFSKRFPEGHILYMNNINDKHAVVYDKDKGKEILEPIDIAIDMAIQHRIVELDELKDKHKDELNEVQLNNINNIVDNEYPPHVCDKLKKMAVKNKDMVKITIDKVIASK